MIGKICIIIYCLRLSCFVLLSCWCDLLFPPPLSHFPSFPSSSFLFSVCVFSVLFALFFLWVLSWGRMASVGGDGKYGEGEGGWMGTKYAGDVFCVMRSGWVLRVERNQPWPGFRGYMFFFFFSFTLYFVCRFMCLVVCLSLLVNREMFSRHPLFS
jgi:hypothetical protein